MLILWDGQYFTRLWCNLEVAAFLHIVHINSANERATCCDDDEPRVVHSSQPHDSPVRRMPVQMLPLWLPLLSTLTALVGLAQKVAETENIMRFLHDSDTATMRWIQSGALLIQSLVLLFFVAQAYVTARVTARVTAHVTARVTACSSSSSRSSTTPRA